MRLTYRDKSAATGNLEICVNNEWQPICAQLFTQADLNVTCRALGFNEYESSSFQSDAIEPIINNTASTLQQPLPLLCSGTEEQLSLCPVSDEELFPCSPNQVVRVRCQGKFHFASHCVLHSLARDPITLRAALISQGSHHIVCCTH